MEPRILGGTPSDLRQTENELISLAQKAWRGKHKWGRRVSEDFFRRYDKVVFDDKSKLWIPGIKNRQNLILRPAVPKLVIDLSTISLDFTKPIVVIKPYEPGDYNQSINLDYRWGQCKMWGLYYIYIKTFAGRIDKLAIQAQITAYPRTKTQPVRKWLPEPFIVEDLRPEESRSRKRRDAEMLRKIMQAYVIAQYGLINRPEILIDSEGRRLSSQNDEEPTHQPAKDYRKIKAERRIYTIDLNSSETELSDSKRTYTCPCWTVAGHPRHLKNGKVIWIPSYPKGKDRNKPGALSPKEYQLKT